MLEFSECSDIVGFMRALSHEDNFLDRMDRNRRQPRPETAFSKARNAAPKVAAAIIQRAVREGFIKPEQRELAARSMDMSDVARNMVSVTKYGKPVVCYPGQRAGNDRARASGYIGYAVETVKRPGFRNFRLADAMREAGAHA